MIFRDRIKSDTLYIGGIAVHKDHRGEGLGRKLIEFIIKYAKNKGYRKVTLDVVDTNPRAKKLYEHLGFTTIKLRKFGFLTRDAGFEAAYKMDYIN